MNDTNLFKLIPMPDAFDLLSKTRDEAESVPLTAESPLFLI